VNDRGTAQRHRPMRRALQQSDHRRPDREQVTLKGVTRQHRLRRAAGDVSQQTTPPSRDQPALLTNLAKQMRAGLDAARPGYYLSIDTYSGSAAGTDGYFNISALTSMSTHSSLAYDMDYATSRTLHWLYSGRLGLNVSVRYLRDRLLL